MCHTNSPILIIQGITSVICGNSFNKESLDLFSTTPPYACSFINKLGFAYNLQAMIRTLTDSNLEKHITVIDAATVRLTIATFFCQLRDNYEKSWDRLNKLFIIVQIIYL